MTLDSFMDDFGKDLHRVAARKPRPARRRILIAVPAATGLAAVGVIALPRGDGVDAIAAARQALSPDNEIVHMVITFKPIEQFKGAQYMLPKTEQWYSAGEKRWRTRTELIRPGKGKAAAAQPYDQIGSPDRVRIYDARKDIVTVYSGVHFMSANGGSGPGVAGGDPATSLRKELDAGDVRDDGIVTHDGKQVRRLVREAKVPAKAQMTQKFVYYMDPQTFAPLGGRMYFQFKGRTRIMSEFKISEYQRLPLNAENRKLLRFDKTAKTKVVWRDIRKPTRKP